MTTTAKQVKLENLTKIFITSNRGEVHAVKKVDLTIEPGEFVTFLGPSGCGKTTLLRMIAGFDPPTQGKIMIGNEDVSPLTPDKRDIGMVFQNYALFPHLNVLNNIGYGLKLQKRPKDEIHRRVSEVLKMVQMDDYADRVPSQMSGGQQQRVALVRALIMHPGVLLFDEPLSNLDAKLRVHMRDEIRKIQKEVGITTIYVTHDQSEAMAVSDKIVIMKEGVIQQVGSPQEVYQIPSNEFVAKFIGQANIFDGMIGKLSDDRVELVISGKTFNIRRKVSHNEGEKVRIVVRPEAVQVGKEAFEAAVKKSIYMGVTQDYEVEFEGRILTITDSNPVGKRVYQEGEIMHFSLDENAISVL
ncbi:MAG: ABC transporter ATP-binding protein [Spirochaetales bacterium]|nr:ABC transporter ATP-binding protein [Spirochaetales bacterium]